MSLEMPGFELRTFQFQIRRSTTELTHLVFEIVKKYRSYKLVWKDVSSLDGTT